jgi:Flp pilus assembly protein TadD
MNAPRDFARERKIRRVLTFLLVALVGGGLGCSAWQSGRSRPSLGEAIALADAGKLDEAEARVRARLAADPDDSASHLLCAQIILKHPDPPSVQAERRPSPWAGAAVDHLDQVRARDRSMAVLSHLCRGNALNRLMRVDEAEVAWLEALRVDPTAPEAGWNLLTLDYVQGRAEEARRLGLQLYSVESDPHDRALLLVELLRLDARPPAAGSVIKLFEPIERYRPDEFHTALALGLARTRANQVEQGIDNLRRLVQTHPDHVEAWDCLLTGLDESGQVELMEDVLGRVPTALSGAPRLLKHWGKVAQNGNRWKTAVDLYRRARTAEPFNPVVEYRLSRALRHVGETAEADRIEQRIRRRDVAIQELRPLFDQATATPDLGTRPHPDLYQRIAGVRERMQLPEEASAWHRLVLEMAPSNEVSLVALARLGLEGESR